MTSVQLVWAHPRADSLTARVVEAIRADLTNHGVEFGELDLYRSGFDPLLQHEDEPDWENPRKRYSSEVMRLADEVNAKTVLVFVFPTWWASVPAIMKGYIDRVFNYGIAYGGRRKLNPGTWRWIALVGETHQEFAVEREADQSMAHALNFSIARYCGASDSDVAFLYNSLGEDVFDLHVHHDALIAQAVASVRQALVTAGQAATEVRVHDHSK